MSPTGLIPWFSKTEGNTYATLLHHPLLFGEIQRSAQEVASPNRGDDTEVSSRWAPPEHQVVQEAKEVLPEGGASVTQGSRIKTGVSEPYGLQPVTILEASKRAKRGKERKRGRIERERKNKTARVKWGRGKREANGK